MTHRSRLATIVIDCPEASFEATQPFIMPLGAAPSK